MWLASGINAADIDDPRPGTVIAGRIEADNLGAPFKLGCLMMMQVLEPEAPVSIGTLYILDDGGDVAIVRLQRVARPLDSRSVLRRWRLAPLRPGPAPMATASRSRDPIPLQPNSPWSHGWVLFVHLL